MRFRASVHALAACIALSSLAPSARAQSDDDRATARALGQEAQQALDNKNYSTAEDRFRRADQLIHAPTLMLGLARALSAQGKYVEAQESYNRIIREGVPPGAPEAFKRAVEEAKKEVDGVAPKVAGVTITVKASATGGDIQDPKVVLDEHPVNAASLGIRRSIDPGVHVLRVSADGYKPGEVRFTVLEGGNADQAVLLDREAVAAPVAAPLAPGQAPIAPLAPVTEQPAPARKASALPWIALGIGGAGLITGAVTGVMAMSDHSSLANDCKNGCPPSQQGNLSSYHTVGAISTAGFIVGGVGVAAGVVLLLTQPKAAPAVGLQITPGSVAAVGKF